MNKLSPMLQAAITTGLAVLSDPQVRIAANQAEGIGALRTLLHMIAAGQLTVSESAADTVTAQPAAEPKPRGRKPKANGAEPAAQSLQ